MFDIDFSEWDRALRLAVVASELEPDEKNRLLLYVVEFRKVQSIGFQFFCHEVAEELGEEGYCQWRIDRTELVERAGGYYVHLGGSGNQAACELRCADIDIRPLDTDALDEVLPGWGKPRSPFARPGIEAMIRLVRPARGAIRPLVPGRRKADRKRGASDRGATESRHRSGRHGGLTFPLLVERPFAG